ncbi:4Fe-4S dicluster domain-containing protein [Siculibacillus lacustris]|uniref:4Fe-4S dicluster domain-containing protein n=1 Tax=Siculibacillus lacustris TaxID=1549641 RepID=A0A4Q9VWS4_9HYPH|nr:formate hydrogenlyase complex iron-sulfur subunit [Siculibacillus lacustris]TBW40324.1 4Fe-4S dicluster domain-containing protein [Siculibacillus lacustris]
MFKLLKEIFRTGEATVKYPFAPLHVEKDFRGKPEHDPEQCIACAACTVACPPNAIAMATDTDAGTRTWSIDYGRCIFCARCEEVCPTDAIRLSTDFELAVTTKADLTRQAVFRLARCEACDEPFAAAKEVAYVQDLIDKTAPSANEAARRRRSVATCPACKRARDVATVAALRFDRQPEETR